MDYTWLVLFIVIMIVSSLLSKRREKQEAARKEEAKGRGAQAARPKPGPARPAPTAGPPPVAPGPFGPVLRPRAEKMPEPTLAPAQDQTPTSLRPRRSLFEEMRAELRKKAEAEPPREAAKQVEYVPPSVRVPEPVQVRREPVPYAPPKYTGESTTRRIVHAKAPRPRVSRRPVLAYDAKSLRRAFVMAEVLNKPVGMRFERDPWDTF